MSALDALQGGYPEEWLNRLREYEKSDEQTDLDNLVVAEWQVANSLDRPVDLAAKMLKALTATDWCDLVEEVWRCPLCPEEYDAEPVDDLCVSQRHSFTDEGKAGPIHVVAVRRAGVEKRHVGWLYALHGMASRGAWQEEFCWRVSTSYGRMVPVRIQKYGFRTLGVTVKFRQRRMVEQVVETLRIAEQMAAEVTDETKPDVIAHSFGTWLIGHALQSHPALKIGRLILLGCALRPDFDWATVFRRKQVEAVLNHYGTEDGVIPWGHYGVPDAGPSGRRGFDPPIGWSEADSPDSILINLPQKGFGHSDFFDEEHLGEMFAKYWEPFLGCEKVSDYPHRPSNPWPSKRWKPKPWPIRAILGGPSKTW